VALGVILLFAGVSHLSWSRTEFLAQVPGWVPFDADLVVVASGVVEVLLGLALVVLIRAREVVGVVAAAFFVVIVPGNISQLVDGDDAFGLDSDAARATRLAFQPLLVAWALWSTGAWRLARGRALPRRGGRSWRGTSSRRPLGPPRRRPRRVR
jgi:uncharacterized membrane protein